VELDAYPQEGLTVSFRVELVAYLLEVPPASFQVEVVPFPSVEVVVTCAWMVAGVVRRLSLEAEEVEGGSRPWQSSHGKADDAMK
jgi:hypothetical protein